VIPWSRTEWAAGACEDEALERELFARRVRVLPAGAVPPLAEVLRAAEERETSLPRSRVGMSVVVAAACFATVVFGRQSERSSVDVQPSAAEVDSGVQPVTPAGTLASWSVAGGGEMSRVGGVGLFSWQGTLECVSPRTDLAQAPVVHASPARLSCMSNEVCSLGDP